ncbi:MAG: CsbD family protein [Deltaproteobacteria bacterium]|nr:CsbD family protein [Deltaproteobacteria bacterium]
MNKDQFKGRWQEFKGELKRQWGKFTDNDLMEVEGDYDKFTGIMQKRYGDQKEEVKRWADDWFDRDDASRRTHP